jgi:hypothetical protein
MKITNNLGAKLYIYLKKKTLPLLIPARQVSSPVWFDRVDPGVLYFLLLWLSYSRTFLVQRNSRFKSQPQNTQVRLKLATFWCFEHHPQL